MGTNWLVNDGNKLIFTGNKMLIGKNLLVTVRTGCFLNNGIRLLLTMKYVSSDVWETWARKLEQLNSGAVVPKTQTSNCSQCCTPNAVLGAACSTDVSAAP